MDANNSPLVERIEVNDYTIEGMERLRRADVVWSSDPLVRAQIERECRRVAYSTQVDANKAAKKVKRNGRVTVIIPNYNYVRFLPDAVTSVMAQTLQPDEVIIVDDCSTDDSLKVAYQLAALHPAVKVMQTFTNSGTVGAPRNLGIRSTDAEFIVCLDSDDMIEPDYIATLHAALVGDSGLGVVYSGVQTLEMQDGQAPYLRQWPDWPPQFSWEWMTTRAAPKPPNNCIPTASMFRREMWLRAGGYDGAIRAAEDVDFWVRALSTGWRAQKVTDRALFTYRRHGTSMSSRKPNNIEYWQRAFDGFEPIAAPHGKRPEIRDYTRPLVSVIIPIGPGHERYLPTALRSLDAQTFINFEVIVIDDTQGKRPMTLPSRPYVRVRATNGTGVSAARNTGIDIARGEFVVFLDADDYLARDALLAMLKEYAKGKASYIYTGWHVVTDGQIVASANAQPTTSTEWIDPLTNGPHGITVLMRTEDAKKIRFDETWPIFEDWDFFARMSVAGLCGSGVMTPKLFYRHDTGQRRAKSEANMQLMRERVTTLYASKLEDVIMQGCCGSEPYAAQVEEWIVPPRTIILQSDGKTIMDYTGPYDAPVYYLGKYLVSRQDPIIRVDPGDVGRLEATGHFMLRTDEPDHVPTLEG